MFENLYIYYSMYFKLRAEAYTYILCLLTHWLTDLLTDWFICPHNALKNSAKVEKSYSDQTLKRFQAASLSTLLKGNSLRILLELYLAYNNK